MERPQSTRPTGARMRGLIGTTVAALLATSAVAVIATFQTGEFYTSDGPVTRGAFGGDVWIKNLTMGQRTLTAIEGGIGNASGVRVYAAPAGSDTFTLIPDDAIGKPGIPVGFALGRDVDPANVNTALEALSGYSLSRMLMTNGTERVRVDMVAAAPQRDNDADNDDPEPEALLVGSLAGLSVTMTPIIGGELDAPVFGTPVVIPAARSSEGETGISVLLRGIEAPLPISMVGLDLSGDFGVPTDQKLVGFRIEIEPGQVAMFKAWFTGTNADVMPSQFEDEDFMPVLAGALGDEPTSSGFAYGGGSTSGYNPGLYGGSGGFFGSNGEYVTAPSTFIFNNPPNNGGGSGGGGGGGGGGGPTPPPPPVPSPGPLLLLGLAFGLGASRRRL